MAVGEISEDHLCNFYVGAEAWHSGCKYPLFPRIHLDSTGKAKYIAALKGYDDDAAAFLN